MTEKETPLKIEIPELARMVGYKPEEIDERMYDLAKLLHLRTVAQHNLYLSNQRNMEIDQLASRFKQCESHTNKLMSAYHWVLNDYSAFRKRKGNPERK